MKFFNVAGPCDPRFHYMIPASPRLPDAPKLIEQGAYFAIHAPRQTGKTTTLRALAAEITAAGRFAALYFSCERLRVAKAIEQMQVSLLDVMRTRAQLYLPADCQPPPDWPAADVLSMLTAGLAAWCQHSARPLVLFFDEVDVLIGDALIIVLSQLRDFYAERPDHAPWSVALCGLRDVRDYKAAAHSLRLSDFTTEEVASLYAQHTADGGPRYAIEAIAAAMYFTHGQPWLVNALGCDLAKHQAGVDELDADHVEAAAGRIIRARATHIDSVLARLRKPPVRRILEPLLAGTSAASATYREDFDYTHHLGLVIADPELRVANPIYREVVAPELAL